MIDFVGKSKCLAIESMEEEEEKEREFIGEKNAGWESVETDGHGGNWKLNGSVDLESQMEDIDSPLRVVHFEGSDTDGSRKRASYFLFFFLGPTKNK